MKLILRSIVVKLVLLALIAQGRLAIAPAHGQKVIEFENFASDIARFNHFTVPPSELPTASSQGIQGSGGVRVVGRHALTLREPRSFLVGDMISISAFFRTGDFQSLPDTGMRLGQLFLTNDPHGHAFQHTGISVYYGQASFDSEGLTGIGGIDLVGTTHLDFSFPPYPEFLPNRWYELSASFARGQNPRVDMSLTVTDYGTTGESPVAVIAQKQRNITDHAFELWEQPWYGGFATDDLSGMIVDRFTMTPDSLLGDFDEDNDVDGRDFMAWQRGQSPDPLSAGELADWQANYGTGSLAATMAVPEPSCFALLVGLVALLRVWR